MSEFNPTKEYLRGILLHYFFLKKSAAEAHRILKDTYGDIISETTCRDWFRRFKSNDFDIKDKERCGGPKKFKDEDLEELLGNSCQTQAELARSLKVTQPAISKRLKALGMVQKPTADSFKNSSEVSENLISKTDKNVEKKFDINLSELPKRKQKRSHDTTTIQPDNSPPRTSEASESKRRPSKEQ